MANIDEPPPGSAARLFSVVGDERRSATISTCGEFRYSLTRAWQPEGYHPRGWLVVVGLNPSTADHALDDATMKRVRSFAKAHDAEGFTMLNLYGFRSTNPRAMWQRIREGGDAVGPQNDATMRTCFADLATRPGFHLVAAWGAGSGAQARDLPAFRRRVFEVCRIAREAGARWETLWINADGSPKHPLYIDASERLRPWPDGLHLRCGSCGKLSGHPDVDKAGSVHVECTEAGSFAWVATR